MANNFQSGALLPVAFAPVGEGSTKINVKGWSNETSVSIFDVTHTGTNAIRARISGVQDHKVTFNASFDLDAPPYTDPPKLKAGQKGMLTCYMAVDQSKHMDIPVIIEKVRYESSVENELRYQVDALLDFLTGTLAYPS